MNWKKLRCKLGYHVIVKLQPERYTQICKCIYCGVEYNSQRYVFDESENRYDIINGEITRKGSDEYKQLIREQKLKRLLII